MGLVPTTPLGWLVVFSVVGSTIWVGIDAAAYRDRYAATKGPAQMTPAAWVWTCLLLWLIAFPIYLVRRRQAPAEFRQPTMNEWLGRVPRPEDTSPFEQQRTP